MIVFFSSKSQLFEDINLIKIIRQLTNLGSRVNKSKVLACRESLETIRYLREDFTAEIGSYFNQTNIYSMSMRNARIGFSVL